MALTDPLVPDADPEGPPEDGRVRRARELKSQTRAQILTAIRPVFAERGYHQASLADLLAAANVARGTFYLHFDSKEAAFRAVLDDLVERITASLRPVDTTSLPGAIEQLVGNLARALSLFADEPALGRLVLRQADGVSDDLAADLERFYTDVAALAARSLTAGQTLGLVRRGDVSRMARLTLGLFREAAAMLAFSDAPPSPDALAREVLDLALRGVLAPTPATRNTP